MVDRPDRLDPIRKIGDDKLPGGPASQPESGSFDSYMQKAGQQPGAGKAGAPSPFDLAHGQLSLAQGPTFDTLLSQTKSAQTTLGDLNTQIQTKNLKLTSSQRYSLRKKLTDANDHLEAANEKIGAPVPTPPSPAGGGIMGKFLGYIEHGQNNLVSAQNQLMNLKDKGENLKPADFLAIQLKLAHAQQEIEYASIMLSKAVEDMKTLFGIQL